MKCLKQLPVVLLLWMLYPIQGIAQIKAAKTSPVSEIIMSAECLKRPNYNLFFESHTSATDTDKGVYWYRLTFYKDCFIKLTLIPNNHSNHYRIDLYSVDKGKSICDSKETVDDIYEQVTFNDNQQATSFRQSIVYTKAVEVYNDEAIYIVITHLSGNDKGYVMEVVTCDDFSYILKANIDSTYNKITDNMALQRADSVLQKLCDDTNQNSRFGSIYFSNQATVVNNYSRKQIDSLDIVHGIDISPLKPVAALVTNTITDTLLNVVTANNSEIADTVAPLLNTKQHNDFFALVNKLTDNGQNYYQLKKAYEYVLKQDTTLSSSGESRNESKTVAKTKRRVRKPQKAEMAQEIYFVPVNTETGVVLTQTSFKLSEAYTQHKVGYRYIDSITAFAATTAANEEYLIYCDLMGYRNYAAPLLAKNKITVGSTIYYVIPMIPLQKGDKFVIPNIYFYANAPVFKEESYGELDKLAKYMNSNNVNILIAGHTNGNNFITKDKRADRELQFRGTSKKLSKKRAEEVRKFLVKKGVAGNRITIKGYGGKQPVIENARTRADSEKNMRVELFIVESS